MNKFRDIRDVSCSRRLFRSCSGGGVPPSFPDGAGKEGRGLAYLSFRISTMLDVMERMSSIVSSPMWAMRNVLFFKSP